MKIYAVSGLGADDKVLEKLRHNPGIEVVHIPWLIPEKREDFHHYILRMADKIDDSQDFYLLGYSFGGIIVQEIHKLKPAKKIVILGSIRSDLEKSILIKAGQKTNIIHYLPKSVFSDKSTIFYTFFRRLFDPKNPKLTQYFRVRDPYYLKWSMQQVAHWKFEKIPGVIQILADRDIVFPLKNSHPDYVIKNATHLFPVTKPKEVSDILKTIFI